MHACAVRNWRRRCDCPRNEGVSKPREITIVRIDADMYACTQADTAAGSLREFVILVYVPVYMTVHAHARMFAL